MCLNDRRLSHLSLDYNIYSVSAEKLWVYTSRKYNSSLLYSLAQSHKIVTIDVCVEAAPQRVFTSLTYIGTLHRCLYEPTCPLKNSFKSDNVLLLTSWSCAKYIWCTTWSSSRSSLVTSYIKLLRDYEFMLLLYFMISDTLLDMTSLYSTQCVLMLYGAKFW